jgi:hypothetical protein
MSDIETFVPESVGRATHAIWWAASGLVERATTAINDAGIRSNDAAIVNARHELLEPWRECCDNELAMVRKYGVEPAEAAEILGQQRESSVTTFVAGKRVAQLLQDARQQLAMYDSLPPRHPAPLDAVLSDRQVIQTAKAASRSTFSQA